MIGCGGGSPGGSWRTGGPCPRVLSPMEELGGAGLPGPGLEVGGSWQGVGAGCCSVPAGGLASFAWYCGGGHILMASSRASSWQLLALMALARHLKYCDNSCRGERSVAPWSGGRGGGGPGAAGTVEGVPFGWQAASPPVLRQILQGGEVGRPVDRGLWRGALLLQLSSGARGRGQVPGGPGGSWGGGCPEGVEDGGGGPGSPWAVEGDPGRGGVPGSPRGPCPCRHRQGSASTRPAAAGGRSGPPHGPGTVVRAPGGAGGVGGVLGAAPKPRRRAHGSSPWRRSAPWRRELGMVGQPWEEAEQAWEAGGHRLQGGGTWGP